MYTFDHDLFLTLNFDGGDLLDKAMLTISGTPMWIPLYLLILWLVLRSYGWMKLGIFILLLIAAMGLADIVAGIFKHSGLLGDLLPQFEPRLRPMFEPMLEELTISPDSLRVLRKGALLADPSVHAPIEAVSGRYGTVSAHAATTVALAWFSALTIRQKWYNWVIAVSVILICYSRIYLACHFPMDILLGAIVGTICGLSMFFLWKKFDKVIEKNYLCGRKSF